jgi:alpha-tubulin suppressor-like RCC1 family protein
MRVVSWGSCSEGVLGYDFQSIKDLNPKFVDEQVEEGCVIVPQEISELKDYQIVSVESGDHHNLTLTDAGQIFCWGRSANGRLGYQLKDKNFQDVPQPVDAENIFTKVACGNHHNLAIDKDGQVWSWGSGFSCQLGHGDRLDKEKPTLIEATIKLKFIDIAAGYYHSLAIGVNGQLFSWGTGADGQLGRNKDITVMMKPTRLTLENLVFSKVVAGEFNSIAITNEGKIYIWGNNRYGQLGNNKSSLNFRSSPRPLEGDDINNLKFISAALGRYHTVALTDEGKLYYWGRDLINPEIMILKPTEIKCSENFVEVKSSKSHILCITDKGELYGMGIGSYGQLTKEAQYFSNEMKKIRELTTVVHVACGSNHSIALVSDWEKCIDLINNNKQDHKDKDNKDQDQVSSSISIVNLED